MPCDHTTERLIDFAYGELPAPDTAAFEAHLVECEACRRQWEEISANIELLDQAAGNPMRPAAAAEPSRIFDVVRRREAARSRRWRRVAIVATAAAVLIAVSAAALRHVEIHSTHMVVRWSDPSSPAPMHAAPDAAQQREDARMQAVLADYARRLDDLDRLASLVVSELKADDVRLTRATAALHLRIDSLQRQNDRRWQAVGRGFHDWYLAQASEPVVDEQTTFSTPAAGDLP